MEAQKTRNKTKQPWTKTAMLEVSQYLTSNYTTGPQSQNGMILAQKQTEDWNKIEDPEINQLTQ
jgi:hypothetical protein